MLARRSGFCATLLLLVATVAATAADKRAFQEAQFEKGQLRYVNRLPVLSVDGTPEEMGRQEAALTGEVVKKLAAYPRQLMTLSGHGKQWDKCVETAQTLTSHASPAYRERIAELCRQGGYSAGPARGRQYDHGPPPRRLRLLVADGRAGQERDRRDPLRAEPRFLHPRRAGPLRAGDRLPPTGKARLGHRRLSGADRLSFRA